MSRSSDPGLAPAVDAHLPLTHADTSADIPRALLEAIRESVIYTDLEGRIVYWNAGATRIFGYSGFEMLGRSPALLYPDEDPERLSADLRHVMEGRDYSGEWRGRRKDGSEVWVDITTTLVHGPRGEPTGFLGIAKDITTRKRAEGDRDRARTDIRLIADLAPAFIAHVDAQRRVRFVNKAYAARFGLTPQQVVGKYLWEVVGQEAYASLRPYVDQVLAGTPVEFEIEIPYEKIGRHYMHCAYAPELGRDGEVLGLIAVITDVSERKRAEQVLRANEQHLRALDRLEAVGRLAGGVAHEANNQMSVVLGMAAFVLRDPTLSASVRQDVVYIQQAAERTAAVSQQLLAFSRQQITQLRVLDVNDVIRGFEPVLRRTMGEDVELRLELGERIGSVRADSGQLEQMLLNLALNARDAMPDGGSIMVETWDAILDEGFGARHNEKVEPGRYTGIRVCDTGHGMDDATLTHIFEPFFTTKGVGQGTGLGLASVYGIIKQHGGHVFVQSAQGRGTNFDIYLPATDTAATARLGAVSDGKVGSGEVVLVVEDDELVRAVLVRALEETGFQVLPASNGAEALDIADKAEQQLDAVITDLAMPGLRGRELAERLEKLRPGLPVLFVSGHADDEVARRGLLDPGRPFLQKPFDPEVVAVRVRELIDGKSRV
jgi:PAS domain S-box-containing protein